MQTGVCARNSCFVSLVATYHCKLITISRRRGESSVAAAAYRSGEKLRCDREGVTKYPHRKITDVLFTKLIGWKGTRSALWSGAELAEPRNNAVVARELTIALPKELSKQSREKLAAGFAEWIAELYGVAVDLAVHKPRTKAGANENHHAHAMFTTRLVEDDHFGSKTRLFDDRATGSQEITRIREEWERRVNKALEMARLPDRVSAKRQAKPQRKLTLREAAALRKLNEHQPVSVTLKQLSKEVSGVTSAPKTADHDPSEDEDMEQLPPPPTKRKFK